MVNEEVRKTLRSLCINYGWSYAVFWRFDPTNHLMLTMEDAYFEEHAGSIVDNMLLQVHMVGQGIIGETALHGQHRWVFADPKMMRVPFLDDTDLGLQFLSGFKTVALVPVEMRGVVQLGSIKEISETLEFVDQVRKLLQENLGVAPGGCNSSSFNADRTDPCGLFASVSSSQNPFCGDVSTSWPNTVEKMGSTIYDLLDVQFEAPDVKTRDHGSNVELLIDPSFGSLVSNSGDMFQEQFAAADFPPLIDNFGTDNLVQWFADSSEAGALAFDAMLSDGNLQAQRVGSISSGLDENGLFSCIQRKELACSSQSSLSNALHSCGGVELPVVNAYNDVPLAKFATDNGCVKLEESLGNVINTIGSAHIPFPFDTHMSLSEGISEEKGHPAAASRKGLFSELGLEDLLKNARGSISSCSTKSCIDEQLPSSKKRKVEAYQAVNSQIQHPGNSWEANLMQPPCSGGQHRDFGYSKENLAKTEVGIWTNSMDAKSCLSNVYSQGRKPDEPAKPSKKRARPGENTKPRPKDRQMIADRIKELRDMIPNGAKLSIDALLSCTFKHMVFMQNLTEKADKLKQVHEPKLIGDGNGLVQKGSSRNATWAYEVGGANLFCPIVVEDLGHPGQMLIEMLCEERGNFLEIADIVRGFGLTILKGLMEERDGKIWAQFNVEAKNRHVTRMDVFVSLMQLVQGTASSELSTIPEPAKVPDSLAPLWRSYQQHVVPLSI